MHYVSVQNLTKSYGITPLFSNISFEINEGEKIALIARNGTGKSTLLRILAGQETADEGKVWIHKDVNVILFEQDPKFKEGKTIAENIFEHDHPVLNAIRDYETVSEGEDHEAINEALHKMDELNAWDFDAKVKQILTKLNIHHLDQKVGSLSGGQRKRVALAKTLIDIGFENSHALLIMDEPTNHLDVEMIEWLENYLNGEYVTLLMVTHDRYFLDAVAEEIWEMEREKIYTYTGDYANYLEKKAARIDSELSSIDKAKNEFRKELAWMRKQPKARTTKSKSRQDNFYEVEKRAKQKITDDQMQLNLKMNRIGGKVIEAKKVYKSYGSLQILKGFDYTFSKGERIGIVGKNGVGKSTFLDILQGIAEPDSGKINIGDTVVFGYYNQNGLEFKHDMRVIEYVKTFAETFPLADGGVLTAAKFLELFLFMGDKQYTYLSALSGGEKRRLQLLTLLFKNPNFLILDEPTNDLDLPTLGVLENFLQNYPGCVLIVSHDRYFMDKLVDHLFVFDGDGIVRDFPGNYTQYRIEEDAKEKDTTPKLNRSDLTGGSNIGAEDVTIKIAATAVAPAADSPKKKFSFKEKREFEILEKEMPALEKEKAAIAEKMNNGATNYDELQAMANRIAAITALMEEKEMRWLELSEYVG
ncbi:MAG: ABC-F family ATP-binding cassette domain-containing protein [Chitinophagaceae bacterium]